MPLVAVKVKTGSAFSIYVLEENGSCELLEFFENAPGGEVARIQRYFDRIKNHGVITNPEQSKHIGNGIYYLRTWDGLRVFYFFDVGKMVICTNGYIKKKNKIDPKEVKRAEIWKQKYFVAKASKTLEYAEDADLI
jgi:phage-related protein